MSIFDIAPAGALVSAIEVAAKSDQREAERCAAAAPKSPRSGLLAFTMAQLRRTFARPLKAAEGVGLAAGTRSRPAQDLSTAPTFVAGSCDRDPTSADERMAAIGHLRTF